MTEEKEKHMKLRKAAEQASLILFVCHGPREAAIARQLLNEALDEYDESVESETEAKT